MMEIDKSYRGRISKKMNPYDIVPKKDFDLMNKEKAWLFKEYPMFNENFICISKNGTIGDIVLVDNLYIGLPSSEGEEIINHDKSGEEAVWKRNEENLEDFKNCWFKYKAKMAKEKTGTKRQLVRNEFVRERNSLFIKHKDFIDSEYEKRENGIFIKIDNEVIYLTGENWMFLQHYYLTESDIYPDFRIVQVEGLWHWEACVADTRLWGEIKGKGRRSSWSVESASIALNNFSITKYAEIPIVSERKDLAEKLFSGKIVKSFEYYPIYFKPLIELPNDEPKSSLTIHHETERRESGNISFFPTKATAYDSTKVKSVSINDEIGKWEECSLIEFISRHSKCHTQGNGKGRFGSTAGEYFKGGGQEFETEFKGADPNNRNKVTGSTANGLCNFFVDYCYTMTSPKNFFDIWGFSIVNDPPEPILNQEGEWVEIGAIKYWEATHDQLKQIGEKKALNGFLRDYPRNTSHMFRNEGGKNNDFDIENLNNHLDHLDQITEYDLNQIVHRGNLRFKGEKLNSDVEWQPHPKGKFETTWIPPADLQNKYTTRDFHGKKINMPDNNHIGVFGVDSYDISSTTDGRGSNGTISGYTKMNMTGAPSGAFFLTYQQRPDKRDDFYDDVIMACQFFGFYALIESNKPRLLEYMKDNGYRGWSMTRPDKKWKDLSEFEREHGGIPSSKQGNNEQAGLLKDYIFDNIGVNLDSDCKVYSKVRIQEWIEFDVNKRKKFDLAVADQLALLGSQYNVKQRVRVNVGQTSGISFGTFSA